MPCKNIRNTKHAFELKVEERLICIIEEKEIEFKEKERQAKGQGRRRRLVSSSPVQVPGRQA